MCSSLVLVNWCNSKACFWKKKCVKGLLLALRFSVQRQIEYLEVLAALDTGMQTQTQGLQGEIVIAICTMKTSEWLDRKWFIPQALPFLWLQQNNHSNSSGCPDCHFCNQGLPRSKVRSPLFWNIPHSRSISSSQCSTSVWKACPWNKCAWNKAGEQGRVGQI